MGKKYIVTNRDSMERGIVVRTRYIVVSIRDPGTPVPRLRRPPAFVDAIFCAFHDAEPDCGIALPSHIRLMSRDDAVRIWEFVQMHHERVGTVVCHCEQGMSRSPAVAMALAERFGGDSSVIAAESQPNAYVLRTMRAAWPSTESREYPG